MKRREDGQVRGDIQREARTQIGQEGWRLTPATGSGAGLCARPLVCGANTCALHRKAQIRARAFCARR